MMCKLRKIVPPGINAKPVVLLSLSGLIVSILISYWWFFVEFFNFYGKISYFDDAGNRCFYDHPKMQPLTDFNANFDVFEIYFVFMALISVYFFLYHFIGSKSVYTMKRLKNPLEFYVRCLAVPVTFIILGVALIYLLNFSYIKIYLYLVPEKSLYPWWDANIWRDLL